MNSISRISFLEDLKHSIYEKSKINLDTSVNSVINSIFELLFNEVDLSDINKKLNEKGYDVCITRRKTFRFQKDSLTNDDISKRQNIREIETTQSLPSIYFFYVSKDTELKKKILNESVILVHKNTTKIYNKKDGKELWEFPTGIEDSKVMSKLDPSSFTTCDIKKSGIGLDKYACIGSDKHTAYDDNFLNNMYNPIFNSLDRESENSIKNFYMIVKNLEDGNCKSVQSNLNFYKSNIDHIHILFEVLFKDLQNNILEKPEIKEINKGVIKMIKDSIDTDNS